MAGLDTPSNGDAFLSPGYTVGFLEQEPHARRDAHRPGERAGRRGRDQGDARPVQRDLHRARRPRRRLRHAAGRDGQPAGAARPPAGLGPGLPARAGHGRPALPARRRRRHRPVRRRAAPGGAVQAAAAGARPAAARRADQPPRRRVRPVAGAAPGEVPGHRGRGHPRPVLPRQRGPVDPRARPRPGVPVRGQLLDLPGDQADAAQGRGRQGREAGQAAGRRAGVGAVQRQGPPGQEQGAPRSATRRWRPRPRRPASSTSRRSRSRPARGWAASWSRATTSARASATGCSSTTCRSRCRATASSASSAPTASARPRCSR